MKNRIIEFDYRPVKATDVVFIEAKALNTLEPPVRVYLKVEKEQYIDAYQKVDGQERGNKQAALSKAQEFIKQMERLERLGDRVSEKEIIRLSIAMAVYGSYARHGPDYEAAWNDCKTLYPTKPAGAV
jgi:hypothetical protein